MQTRSEQDSMGTLEVPANALYGAQTQRAVNNFHISGLRMPPAFIRALATVKLCAARANVQLGVLDADIAAAIEAAASKIIAGEYADQFPIDIFQTGSATSSNMNMNEVIAHICTAAGTKVHPNDHVNMGQSSNDVIPTTIHLSAALEIQQQLLPALAHFDEVAKAKAQSCAQFVKTGRTHLMDAMPVRLDQSIGSWAAQLAQGYARLEALKPRLHALAQGGTAVGTGINAHPEFAALFVHKLSEYTGVAFTNAPNFFVAIGSQDTAAETSGALKTIAVSVMKIANDLRWMNSGPLAGLGEIELEALQPGSSIMPGKVNPVIPEAAAMVAAQVIGNDAAITVGAQASNFELNVMLPMIAYNLLQSIEILANSITALADKAVASFVVNQENLQTALGKNPILVTALNPIIGYSKAAEIAKLAYKQKRAIIDVAVENCDLSREQLEKLLDPAALTQGGIQSDH